MKYDEDTMEVEGTLEQLTSLRQYLITRFGEERGISTVEQKQETLGLSRVSLCSLFKIV
jgi:hypothetical protein